MKVYIVQILPISGTENQIATVFTYKGNKRTPTEVSFNATASSQADYALNEVRNLYPMDDNFDNDEGIRRDVAERFFKRMADKGYAIVKQAAMMTLAIESKALKIISNGSQSYERPEQYKFKTLCKQGKDEKGVPVQEKEPRKPYKSAGEILEKLDKREAKESKKEARKAKKEKVKVKARIGNKRKKLEVVPV